MDKRILNPNQKRKICNYRTFSCDNITIIKQFFFGIKTVSQLLIHRKCSIASYSVVIPVIFDDGAYFKPFKPKPLTQIQIILPPMFRLPYHVRLIHHRKGIDRLRLGHYF